MFCFTAQKQRKLPRPWQAGTGKAGAPASASSARAAQEFATDAQIPQAGAWCSVSDEF